MRYRAVSVEAQGKEGTAIEESLCMWVEKCGTHAITASLLREDRTGYQPRVWQ